jgi:hypothetical protein
MLALPSSFPSLTPPMSGSNFRFGPQTSYKNLISASFPFCSDIKCHPILLQKKKKKHQKKKREIIIKNKRVKEKITKIIYK